MTEQLPDTPGSTKPAPRRSVSKAAFRRLPHYHQIVSAYEGLGRRYISSKELSQILDINETLVRKDMADLEIRGRQNQGYAIGTMKRTIEDFLGLQEITDALIIGAGHLGKALALYHGFEPYGLRIAGILEKEHGAKAHVIRRKKSAGSAPSPEMIAEYKQNCDIIVAGVGD